MAKRDLPPELSAALRLAWALAARLGHACVGTEHLLLALAMQPQGADGRLLHWAGLTGPEIAAAVLRLHGRGAPSDVLPQGLTQAARRAVSRALNGPERLLTALLRESGCSAVRLLEHCGICPQQLFTQLCEGELARKERSMQNTRLLDQFGVDMLERAGKREPVIGRRQEIETVLQILSRRHKNNPALIGEPGVGKTAIVEGVAQYLAAGTVPEPLRGKRLYALDMASVIAGTKYRGEFEERVRDILAEVRRVQNVILFVDEMHTLVGAGAAEGAIDAANLLKPALGRGELQLIGATTLREYRSSIEKDAALERRFQPVNVPEPDSECCERMLCALRGSLEAHHGLKITDEAITAAVRLSTRYICDRYLPDKAIDLLDEAASRVRVEGSAARSRVEASDVADVVSAWTGVPASSITQSESERLLHLEEALHRRVVGQDEAVSAVARAIRRGRVGLSDPRRPLGSFLFLGPTGVGKTELCRALAEAVYGDEDALIRFDMSEYMEKHAVSKLIGSPPGYVGYGEGGQLTERVRRRPWSVVLFDEIEKAHEDVYNLLLQIMEDGRLTDSEGRRADFRSTIVVMTSNVGAKAITENRPALGFSASARDGDGAVREAVMSELRQTFRPEFLNRVDDAIVFRRLTPEDVRRIARGMTGAVCERMRALGVQLEVTDAALSLLAERGFDPAYGARPLRRCICTDLEDPAADALLNGTVSPGDLLVADARDGKIVLEVR